MKTNHFVSRLAVVKKISVVKNIRKKEHIVKNVRKYRVRDVIGVASLKHQQQHLFFIFLAVFGFSVYMFVQSEQPYFLKKSDFLQSFLLFLKPQ